MEVVKNRKYALKRIFIPSFILKICEAKNDYGYLYNMNYFGATK